MSLINDALKRARLRKEPSAPGPETPAEAGGEAKPPAEPPLEPVESSAPKPWVRSLVFSGAVVALAGAAWLFWQGWVAFRMGQEIAGAPVRTNLIQTAVAKTVETHTVEPAKVAEPAPETNAELAIPEPALAQIPVEIPEIVATPEPVAESSAAETPAAQEPNPGATQPSAAATMEASPANPEMERLPSKVPVEFPPLQLRGIYYRLSRPSVLINNRTLYLGDLVDGVRVVDIQRYRVTVEMSGQTTNLVLK